MFKKMSIRTKLMLDLLPLAAVILALLALLWAGEIYVFKESRAVYYEKIKTLSDLLITADRDFYQAMLAEEEMIAANKHGDSLTANQKIEEYEENAAQVLDGLGQIRAIMEQDPYLFTDYRIDGIEFSCQELLDQTHSGYDVWKETCDAKNTDMMETYFHQAREPLNLLQDIVAQYALYQDRAIETFKLFFLLPPCISIVAGKMIVFLKKRIIMTGKHLGMRIDIYTRTLSLL